MNEEQWERECAAQTSYLAAQLRALDKRPIQRRKAFVEHEIRCAGCGDPVVQVLALDPYRVLRYRSVELSRESLPADMNPRARAEAMARRKRSIRLDRDWLFFPIAEGDAEPGRQLVQGSCRCRGQHNFTLAGILQREGNRSTSRPTRH